MSQRGETAVWCWVGGTVALVQIICHVFFTVFREPPFILEFLLMIPLIFPGGMLLLFSSSAHGDSALLLFAAVINWVFYTGIVGWMVTRKRSKIER